ncbi:adhesion regulating molecule [Pisolithus marmoratus]|nr:adhesion regulating molecule [Pisolithus marmoratus]
MTTTLTDSQTLLAFKAGRSFRRGNTSFVDADATKGAVVLSNGDDGLLHFMWKERPSGTVREDLILFPGDARMEKVTQERSGRTFVLRFDSSDQKHFFWMQDVSNARDDELVGNLNRFLADPTAIPIWNAGGPLESQQASSSSDPAGGSSSGSGNMGSGSATHRAAQAAAPPAGLATAEQLARLRALVTSMGASSTRAGANVNLGTSPSVSDGVSSDDDDISLTDILTPQVILPLITSHPSLLPLLFQHLPPEFVSLIPPSPPQPGDEGEERPVGDPTSLSFRSPSTSSTSSTASWASATAEDIAGLTETLQRTIHSNPFRESVAQLDRVLKMGMGAALVGSLGMKPEAGESVGAFLRAVSEQGKRVADVEGEDSMDQD